MLYYYNKNNKQRSQHLRKNLTNAETLLWSRLRRKQLCGVPFYRQKPILNYIIDFFAPSVNLVIEIDGGQHYEDEMIERDQIRDKKLAELNLKVLRFSNLDVLNAIDDVVLKILNEKSIYTIPP